jgi:hypothetical protein
VLYAVPEQDRGLQALAYLMNEDDILLGQEAFYIGMLDPFFYGLKNRTLKPTKDFSKLDCPSLVSQQTWSIGVKLYRVIMEALNTKSLNLA